MVERHSKELSEGLTELRQLIRDLTHFWYLKLKDWVEKQKVPKKESEDKDDWIKYYGQWITIEEIKFLSDKEIQELIEKRREGSVMTLSDHQKLDDDSP